jgi:hypothetical protein
MKYWWYPSEKSSEENLPHNSGKPYSPTKPLGSWIRLVVVNHPAASMAADPNFRSSSVT